jgi:VanZ family protein
VILILTSIPNPPIPRQLASTDKLVHFAMYAGLGYLLARAQLDAERFWRGALLTIVVALAAAAIDEWHQQFIPGRSMDVADWRADALGAILGASAAVAGRRLRRDTGSVNDH